MNKTKVKGRSELLEISQFFNYTFCKPVPKEIELIIYLRMSINLINVINRVSLDTIYVIKRTIG